MHHQPTPTVRGHAPLDAWLPLLDGTYRFLALDGRAFIRVPASLEGFRCHSIRSDGFRDWFFAQASGRLDKVPSSRTWSAICQYLEADAARDSRLVRVSRRVAPRESADAYPESVLIDLANPAGDFIEISTDGVRLNGASPGSPCRDTGLPFETSTATRELPVPSPLASDSVSPQTELELLRSTLNLRPAASSDWLRCLAWLLSALNPSGPYPILVLRGPPASGKSLAGRILRSLVDPATAPFSPIPRSAAQLFNFARHNWVLAFDHVSRITPGIADALCRITSGAGLTWGEPGRRDLVQHWIKRPVLLTVTADCELPPDLASRAFFVTLPEHAPESRRCEADVTTLIEDAFPKILGALYAAISRALAGRREPPPNPNRHAGALVWAIAAFPALESGLRAAIAEPPPPPQSVAQFRALVAQTPHWTGTAAALLPLVRAAETPKGVSQVLNRHALALADAGIRVAFQRVHRGERVITLDASPDFSPPPQPSSPDPLTPPPKSHPIFAPHDAPIPSPSL